MAGSETDDRAEFEQLVAEAMDRLPGWVHERLENVEILVEEHPPKGSPGLMGLYEGVPLTNRGNNYTWTLPDRITLYRSTIERSSGHEPERVRRAVIHTVVHEVAHFFGISDERLRDMGRY
ncbi:MAG: metallopeptidase family protein [Actinomycetota bacterium]